MLILDAAETQRVLSWPALIGAIEVMFKGGGVMPPRHHHEIAMPGGQAATLLLMPAWVPGRYLGVKQVSVFPDNHLRGLPAIFGSYLLSSGETGEMLAVIEGGELTARRTAAASALAAHHLAREDSTRMLMVGTGRLSLNLIQAHATIRALSHISVWGRSADKAAATVREARALGFDASICSDLEAGVRGADLISCATLSDQPLVRGAWLKPGTHLDLVGAFKPTMRESDDEVMRRGAVFVDTREGAFGEAGDILQAIESGALAKEEVRGELADLIAGRVAGRRTSEDITVFKSVGAALEDLAGAILAYETATDAAGRRKA